MDPIVFDNTVVQGHRLYSSCANMLQQVCDRDYGIGKYVLDSRIECLDMDVYERIVCGGRPDMTVDAVIGICTCRNDKRKVEPRLMLIEFRMGYESTATLSIGDLVSKVKHTKMLLGQDVPINGYSYFIFDDSISEQVKRWFSNKVKARTDAKNLVAWSIKDFKRNVLAFEDLPYKPIYEPSSIKEEARNFLRNDDVAAFLQFIDYWIKVAGKCKYSNPYEFESLKEVIDEIWSEFNQLQFTLTADEQIDVAILQEDIDLIF